MEIKIIQEEFFWGGVFDANLYREGLKKGRELSITLEVNKCKYFVYVPELFKILTSKKIPLLNGQIADGTIFSQDYVTGYNSGIEYFKNEFPEIHLMVNADQYFSSLHYCYFHQAPNFTKNNGWIHWVNSYPTSLNPKQIVEYGFCAGIQFCINKLKKKNPTLFKKFVNCEHNLAPQQTETEKEQETPKTFEELFYNPEHAEPCLKILSELQPPIIDAINNYIGKAKGVFPLWVNVLKNHKPQPLIKHFKDTVYCELLNRKVKGLNLTKDASEFRKNYSRLINNNIELDIKTILSQYSQSGKLGK